MTKGPAGLFPRPLDEEKGQLGIAIETEENIKEATVRSANGHIIDGERDPFFSIDTISENSVIPDLDEHFIIFTDDSVEVQDIMLFINNLNQFFDTMIFPSNVYLSPTAETSRPFSISDGIPKIRFKIKSHRGTRDQFIEAVNEVIANVHPQFGGPEFIDDERIAYILVEGNVPFTLVKDWAKDILGPRNKKVTDIYAKGFLMEEE
jgi:hypothetical protein